MGILRPAPDSGAAAAAVAMATGDTDSQNAEDQERNARSTMATMTEQDSVDNAPVEERHRGLDVDTESPDTNGADAFHTTLMVGGVTLFLLLPLIYTIYRCSRRGQKNYEDIPPSSINRKRNSRCSQASIHSCNHKRPIDFVLPSIPPALTSLPSPGCEESGSMSSSSSSDIPLWARLALLEPGPTLLGGLNPELYRLSIEKPEDEDERTFPEGHVGRLWFGLDYDSSAERLSVLLMKAKNLPSRVYGCNNCCDPFVRIYVLPEERRYIQSKTKKKTCNPNFDENFVFQIPSKTIEERTLKLTVLDSDRGKRYTAIGHVLFPLKDLDLTATETIVVWKDLVKDADEAPSDAGELLVSLCYNENIERLTVTVCEAQGLKIPEGQTTVDSYVKLSFMLENKVVKTKKTMVAKKSADPKYNESFHFRLPRNSLNAASVVLQVTASSGSQKDKSLGRMVLGSYMFVRGKPLDHWNEAISAEHKQIRQWHKLS